jgi:hypothetical protein
MAEEQTIKVVNINGELHSEPEKCTTDDHLCHPCDEPLTLTYWICVCDGWYFNPVIRVV